LLKKNKVHLISYPKKNYYYVVWKKLNYISKKFKYSMHIEEVIDEDAYVLIVTLKKRIIEILI
jgi:hypothetical protein